MTESGKYTTVCRVCQQPFTAAPFTPVIGGGYDQRMMRYGAGLWQHVQDKHPQLLAALVIVGAFTIEDPILRDSLNPIRHAVHEATTKNQVSDVYIEDAVKALESAGQLDVATITKAWKEMRDALTEQGKYGLQIPEPTQNGHI